MHVIIPFSSYPDPHSSLLTIGRVPVMNILQNYSPQTQDEPSYSEHSHPFYGASRQRRMSSLTSALHEPVPYSITAKHTWGIPNQVSVRVRVSVSSVTPNWVSVSTE